MSLLFPKKIFEKNFHLTKREGEGGPSGQERDDRQTNVRQGNVTLGANPTGAL
jgi:hypothetical protein